MTYPADLADELCGIVEHTRKGKAAKTAAYRRALGKLTGNCELAGEDGYAVFSVLRACAWAEGADVDRLEFDEAMAQAHYLGRRVQR